MEVLEERRVVVRRRCLDLVSFFFLGECFRGGRILLLNNDSSVLIFFNGILFVFYRLE